MRFFRYIGICVDSFKNKLQSYEKMLEKTTLFLATNKAKSENKKINIKSSMPTKYKKREKKFKTQQ